MSSTYLLFRGTHSLALSNTGFIYSWGANTVGQLGDGQMVDRTLPYQISTTTVAGTVIAISAGSNQMSLALTSAGKVYCWGHNGGMRKCAGPTTTTHYMTPIEIVFPVPMTEISAGNQHSLAVGNGEIYGWGQNSVAQADPTAAVFSTPIAPPKKLVGVSGVTNVVAGYDTSFYLSSGGSVFGWGGNIDGNLLTGGTSGIVRPTPISLVSNSITAMCAGYSHVVAMSSNGIFVGS